MYCCDKLSLEELFFESKRFDNITEYFYKNSDCNNSAGFCFMFAKPQNGSAMKRMNMFLRWMVRKSEVDLGIWKFIPKSELLIPLDVHVARLSREMELIVTNKSNNMKAVKELTSNLRLFDKNDPVKYDFAIFGKGIEESLLKSSLAKV